MDEEKQDDDLWTWSVIGACALGTQAALWLPILFLH
jgi:hypothetical protein